MYLKKLQIRCLISRSQLLGHVVFLFFLTPAPLAAALEVDRIGFGTGIDYMRQELFDSNDIFTNPGDVNYCSSRNSVCLAKDCLKGSCCKCQCNASRSFYSLEQGCVLFEDLYKTRKESPVGQGCNYLFYHTEKLVVPLFKSNTNAFTVEGIRLKNFKSTSGNLLSPDNKSVRCVANEVLQIDENGTTLIDNNKFNGFFEVQSSVAFVGVELVYVKNLLMTTRQYSDWRKLKGKLIRLNIKCTNSFASLEESSCILFKVNGTSIGEVKMSSYASFQNPVVDSQGYCLQTYCLDEANASCNDHICCKCICDNVKYPFVDTVSKKCVQTAPTTQAVSTTGSSTSSTASTTTAQTTHSQFESTSTQATSSTPSSTPVSTNTTPLTISSTTEAQATTKPNVPNVTVAILNPVKNSTPTGAIIGGVVGFVVVVIFIVLLIVWLRKRRQRKRQRPNSPTRQGILNNVKLDNGNDTSYPSNGGAPLLTINQIKNEDIEMQATMNPYYKTNQQDDVKQADKNNTKEMENLYYSPADLKNGPSSAEKQNMYYSSAEMLENNSKDPNHPQGNIYNQPAESKKDMNLPGLTQEYCYARTDSPCSPIKGMTNPGQDVHYKALQNASPEPDTYQSLTNPISRKPVLDPGSSEQVNPYYKPAGVPDKHLMANPETREPPIDPEAKYQSLRNNAGSRENIAPQYQVPDTGNNEAVYQGLNASSPDTQYTTLTRKDNDEYLDMSIGSQSGEYMYADPKEHKI